MVISSCLAGINLCRWYSKSQHSLHSSFSMTLPFFHLFLYNFVFFPPKVLLVSPMPNIVSLGHYCVFSDILLQLVLYILITSASLFPLLVYIFCIYQFLKVSLYLSSTPFHLLLLLLLLLLNGRCLISTNGYISFYRYAVNKTPHTSTTFQRILLVCIKKAFCNSLIFVSIPMVFNLFSRALVGAPRAPTIDGTFCHFHIPHFL